MVNQQKSEPDSEGILIVGCGYLGRRVALAVQQSSENQTRIPRIWATTRSHQRTAELENLGVEPVVADWTDRETLQGLPKAGRILVAVSYDRSSRLARYESQVGGLQNLLSFVSPTAKLTYISTTGVYHQTDGSWVDESSPARPSREGGRAHLDAETLLKACRSESPTTVLRLSGIYGPDRVPRSADVIAGRPIRSPESGYLNLIHVRDAARAVLSTWKGECRRMYVVSDDAPVVRGEFYREIARQCGVAEPRFEPPRPDAPVLMRSSSNKRIRNERMKEDLVAELEYPTYREGLADVLAGKRQ